MESKTNILKKITAIVQKTFWILGLHAFSIILISILVDIALGGLIFYKYVFLAESQSPTVTESIVKFDEKGYQKVVGELQSRQQSNEEFVILEQPKSSESVQNNPEQ
jgi:hypothetical protein